MAQNALSDGSQSLRSLANRRAPAAFESACRADLRCMTLPGSTRRVQNARRGPGPLGAQATPVISALCRAPGGAVCRQDPHSGPLLFAATVRVVSGGRRYNGLSGTSRTTEASQGFPRPPGSAAGVGLSLHVIGPGLSKLRARPVSPLFRRHFYTDPPESMWTVPEAFTSVCSPTDCTSLYSVNISCSIRRTLPTVSSASFPTRRMSRCVSTVRS
jgi:hypothetical protein